jgi:hypothetical protein
MSEKAKQLAQKVKAKTKHVLHIDDSKHQLEQDDDDDAGQDIMEEIQSNAGFNNKLTLNAEASTLKQFRDQFPNNVRDLPHKIRHPKDSAKAKAASQLATSEEPYLSGEDDKDLIAIEKKLTHAQDANDQYEEVYLTELIGEMHESRTQKKVAWMTSRYIHRAKVVSTVPDKLVLRSQFRWRDYKGDWQGSEWSQWFQEVRLFARSLYTGKNFDNTTVMDAAVWDRDMLLKQVERIVMASSPWQRWVMQLSQLQSWENSRKTLVWFAVWVAVWAMNWVASFMVCLALYSVLRRKFGYATKEKMEEAQDRLEDETKTAHTFGEMINRHGSDSWIDPVIDTVTATVQPYMKDSADWLEVLNNFWDYRDSRSSDSAVTILLVSLLFLNFTSTEFCVRLATLGGILGFFLHHPLSIRYPRYPHILLPLHWILWDVPTHTEISFNYLRDQANNIRKANVDLDPEANIFATDCSWEGSKGTVIISFNGIRFVRKFPEATLWKRSWLELDEAKKGDGKTAVLKTTENFLDLIFKDGTECKLETLQNKDQMFNIIQAFSNLSWQQIPL